jgi:hypothetical protein
LASAYDEALADALGDGESSAELAERLRAGEADDTDRRAAREQLDDDTLHRFQLAHPVAPAETAVEVDLGEIDVSDLKDRLKEVASEHDGREVLVRLAVRVERDDE